MIEHKGKELTRDTLSDKYMYTAGLDVGHKRDYMACVVLGCTYEPPKYGETWLPLMFGIHKLKSALRDGRAESKPVDLAQHMCDVLIDKFPLTAIGVDSTHDPSVVGVLEKRYGVSVVKEVPFNNKSKTQMWSDTLYYIASPEGFPWADPPKGTVLYENIQLLQEQISTERATMNDKNMWVFDHPSEHNDLLHAFNLACMQMRDIQNRLESNVKIYTARAKPRWQQRSDLAPPFTSRLDRAAGRARKHHQMW